MTLKQFKDTWIGKKADYDGLNGGQCVDLLRYYVRDVLELPQMPMLGANGKAADLWKLAQSQYYEKLKNTPEFVPQEGDIAVWDTDAGEGYGHVAIVLKATLKEFTSLDQNYPTLSKVTQTQHNYDNVIGFLRKKVQTSGGQTTPEKIYTEEEMTKARLERDANWNLHLEDEKKIKKLEKDLKNLQEEQDNTQARLEESLQIQADATPEKAFEEIKQKMEEAHSQEILSIKMQQDNRIKEATKTLESDLKESKEKISSLESQLLTARQSWKSRMTSRKFLMSVSAATIPVIMAFATLFGVEIDPTQLSIAMTALFSLVALFVVPEAITDYQERMS